MSHNRVVLCIAGGLNLSAYLIMPVQRMPRYRLLLEDLLNKYCFGFGLVCFVSCVDLFFACVLTCAKQCICSTWSVHADYDPLRQALVNRVETKTILFCGEKCGL